MADLKKLKRKRGGIKQKLHNFVTFLAGIEADLENNLEIASLAIVDLQSRLEKLDEVDAEFNDAQTQIEYLCEDNDLNEQYKIRDEFMNTISSNAASAKCILSKFKANNAVEIDDAGSGSQSVMSLRSQMQNVKLPTIKLPKFNGNYSSWLEFKDTYVSLIHSNNTISPIQKYHYLRATLENEALKVIQSLEFSEQNYEVAWELLCNRFDNSRLLINNHIKALFNLDSIIKESSTSLRNLSDNVFKHLRALKTLKEPVEFWDRIIIFVISSKLDKQAMGEWENKKPAGNLPTLVEMQQFLRDRADWLETLELNHGAKDLRSKRQVSFLASNSNPNSTPSSRKKCNFCEQAHLIYNCKLFLNMSVLARIQKAKELRLCLNCLCTGHDTKVCRSRVCKLCKSRHNFLLHQEREPTEPEAPLGNDTEVVLSSQTHNNYVLLSTVIVKIKDSSGNMHNCRSLLDCGSQSHFISQSFCEKLKLKQTKINMSVLGINNAISSITNKCEVSVQSRLNSYTATIPCLVLQRITNDMPAYSLDTTSLNIPKHIQLADPSFYESKEIDLLIGAGLFWDCLTDGRIDLKKNELVMQNTLFGWVIAGKLNANIAKTHCYFTKNIQNDLQIFWQTEECNYVPPLAIEDEQCEDHFCKTFSRDPQGRFIVRIPLKSSPDTLGDSKSVAVKRLIQLEKKFLLNIKFKNDYIQFLKDYEVLGHMSLVSDRGNSDLKTPYYLPHHGVVKEDSITTKLRVVFNGSSASESGVSVNSIQMTGPNILNDLFTILLRFRQHKIVVTSDISKMYRQILVHPDDRYLQRIVWRNNSKSEIKIYNLNTVTYGTACAPFLALRCLKQLVLENENKFPISSNLINRDTYMDDLITGFDSEAEAITTCKEISFILKQGCFELRKWASNSSLVTNEFKDEAEPVSVLFLGDEEYAKTLGIQWVSKSDMLTYKISEMPKIISITKRHILATIARIFDPLGLLSPVIIVAKIILQLLWLQKIDWDDIVPDDIWNKWQQLHGTLAVLNQLRIPRQVITSDAINITLHGFCDSSMDAYGSCIYVRSEKLTGEISVVLLCAKTKVAPLKPLTIPRLELCGALMLSRLMKKVLDSFTFNAEPFFWNDSQVVLWWLKTQPRLLQTFVANRVAEIQATSNDRWYYVNTKENPADIASRGILPHALITSKLWWNGPSWLSLPRSEWPISKLPSDSAAIPELRKTVTACFANENDDTKFLFNRFSKLKTLQRVVAYCLRFLNNIKKPKQQRETGELTVDELKFAMIRLVKVAQYSSFKEDIDSLMRNQKLSARSNLLKLAPFLDSENCLRVGGRLKHSHLKYDSRHPLLLHGKHALTKLIITHEHQCLLHAGPQLVLSRIRQNYWPTSGITVVKNIIRSCIVCFKYQPKPINTYMGDLPEHRVTAMLPFMATGIDYAGPFLVKDRKGRGCKLSKAYICLFVCFSSKAIHLELVTELSSECFIAALRRFVCRRGKPAHLYSDNGTNFLGASGELKKMRNFFVNSKDPILRFCADEGIVWHFIPPNAPHFGGLWESAVKSCKRHFLKVINDNKLTYEEFITILIQIEGILNSRPLYPLSTDPSDISPLTPSHFLIGRSMQTIPDPSMLTVPTNRLSRYQLLQQLTQGFWKRWSRDYLSHLQQRQKWFHVKEVKLNALVIIKNDNLPPSKWLLGRILQVHPGADGVVRVVTLKTSNGLLKRPVTKICPLPDPEDGSEVK